MMMDDGFLLFLLLSQSVLLFQQFSTDLLCEAKPAGPIKVLEHDCLITLPLMMLVASSFFLLFLE